MRTGGNAANGGGFRTGALGTDLSLQDSPEATYTDLVIGSAGNENKLSSALRPFVDADRGNILNITSGTGFTTGRYEVVSVSAGVATMDRAVGTAASTGGAGRLGGALATPADALASGVAVSGNTIWVRSGSYTLGASALATNVAGTGSVPNALLGYSTTRGDNGRPTITATSGTPTQMLNIVHSNWVVRNFIFDCANLVTIGVQLGLSRHIVENVRATRWTQRGFYHTGSGIVQDCEADNGIGGSGMVGAPRGCFIAGANGLVFTRCYARDSASNGFVANTGVTLHARDCIVDNMDAEAGVGGHGFWGQGISSSAQLFNCTFYDLQGSGIYASVADASDNMIVQNCVFSTITRFGMESTITDYATGATEAYARRFKGNAFHSCTLGNQSLFPAGVSDITVTVDPFVGAAGGDFDLNNTAGGGASLRSVGVPGTMPGLSSVSGAMDIGALQATVASSDVTDGGLVRMRDLFRELTGEFSTTRIPNTVVDSYLNLALADLNDIVGFAWADDSATTLVDGTQEYSLPADAADIVWVEHNNVRLTKADLEELERVGEDWRNQRKSTPKEWALYGNKLVLIPKPDAAAVAASSTVTMRYIRSPRDISVYGPEGLVRRDYDAVVYKAAEIFSAAHPDSATAIQRITQMQGLYDRMVAGASERYLRRRLVRGAPNEALAPSGAKRGR